MSTEPTKRPTIAELEAILNDPNPGTISIAPDGSVHVLPSGMARESQAEVDSLRARLAALTAEAEKLRADAEAAKEREGQLRRALEGTYELANSITIYPYDKQDRILRQARKALAGEGAS